ncbi:MAG: hypothetical protein U0787_21085 [Polyangia bacterium]
MQDIAREVKDSVAQNSMAISSYFGTSTESPRRVGGITAGPFGQRRRFRSQHPEVTEGLRDLVGKGSSEVDSTGTAAPKPRQVAAGG